MTTEQRLERLDRQNGRLKRGMIGMVVASLSLLVMGQALPPKVHDVLVAKTFVLKDGKGNERARLWSAALGPRLTFYAETGTTPESISADFTGGGLYLYARSVGGRAVLFADRHGMGFETSFNPNSAKKTFQVADFRL